MFTGIVEATGTIRDVADRASTRRFRIECPALAAEVADGDSVAVDGACLTVTERAAGWFAVDVIGTTLARTVAGGYADGSRVNLERAMQLNARLDGHLVQGHVDGVGELLSVERDGEFWTMRVRLPDDVAAQTVPRGSVTINGVSLTVAELDDDGSCRIGLIPYTFEHTNLGSLEAGARVNVEGDLIGKYVARLLDRGRPDTGERP